MLSNAAKFTTHGIISLDVRNQPGDPGWICFVVRDTGIGMTPEQVARLFQPSRRPIAQPRVSTAAPALV
ncbi:MAG: hypothetical protein HC876_20710, partial [Chloroflexaceae bacterium]|nr:hypothetical protein [Chloroflexaceae bacterium]